jgi:PAS domain S-box-containing protein
MTTAVALERQILDALPITVYTVGLDGRIKFVNRAWSRFAKANGAPQLAENADIYGKSIWDAMSDAAPREEVQRAMTLLRGGHAQSLAWEFPCNSPDEERVFLMQVSPLYDGHAVTAFVFSTVDITHSHRAREKLIDTGLALSDAIGVERVLQEVGRQVRQAIPCEAMAIALGGDVEPDQPRLAYQAGFEAEPRELEATLRETWREALDTMAVATRPNGGSTQITVPMRWGSQNGALTVVTGVIESPGMLAELKDTVTSIGALAGAALGRAELIRRAAEKRRLEAIAEVATGVAHELRNPLFGISSAGQLLRYRVREDPVVEKNVGRILREVERLNGMATALLEYGHSTPIRLAPADPDAVWIDVVEAQRGRLESKARATCNIDVGQLAQVFAHALSNAIDAASEGTDLTLSSSVLPSGSWRCVLRNKGPVIPPDVLSRAFEIFYSTKPGATGIGLALSHRIVAEHGGTISLDSVEESGTTLTVVLPAASSA